eukprot:CAMPEP_0198494236 /NCGR_PEP_ID=MMETSP1462-20131121/4530_1 /TAXON_ID=1333877 /ORGANISM="Brandtodinium nutriculum, Strain RCC3387" /LENGTH=201 /DNA_ID=CAMNT_0044222973 /DNA_START=185 /DNA_END=787 /DNA_ORIENTATION=+
MWARPLCAQPDQAGDIIPAAASASAHNASGYGPSARAANGPRLVRWQAPGQPSAGSGRAAGHLEEGIRANRIADLMQARFFLDARLRLLTAVLRGCHGLLHGLEHVLDPIPLVMRIRSQARPAAIRLIGAIPLLPVGPVAVEPEQRTRPNGGAAVVGEPQEGEVVARPQAVFGHARPAQRPPPHAAPEPDCASGVARRGAG